MSSQTIGSAFELPAKSLKFVLENWQMFLLVNVLALASGLAVLFKDSPKADDRAAIFQNLNSGGIGSGSELASMLGIGLVAAVIIGLISIFLYAMTTSLELKASKGQAPTLNELIDDGKKYWLPLFGQALLMALIVVVGLILLIVPGVIAFSRIIFAPYILIDKKLGVIDSIKASNELSKQHTGKVWGMIGVLVLIGIIASLFSSVPRIGELIGSLIMIGYGLLVPLRYLQLTKHAGTKADPAAPILI